MARSPWRGRKQFASPAEVVTRLVWWALILTLTLVGCDPSVGAGPDSPRPVPSTLPAPATTVQLPSTTITETLDSATVACDAPFCLVYHIDPAASWSDGTPVTAADFVHTVAIHRDSNVPGPAPGYEVVEAVDAIDEKTVRLSFARPYGAWQTLFSRVLREGDAVGDIASTDASGPFVFVEWAEGDHVIVERNPQWWARVDPLSGAALGDVREIRFVFIDTLEEMVEALEAGEVDVISARAETTAVTDISEMENVEFTLAPGPFWEHIDFHHEDRTLSQRWAREAFSLAIDREKVLDRTLRLLDPAATALDNTVWMANTGNYEPHFPDGLDPVRAEEILVENGCERGDDGIYVCAQRRMSFVWASTNDDPARFEIFESVREDLAAVGIEIVADLQSPSTFVTRDFLFGGSDVWQLVNFSWRARSDPSASNPTYYCDDAGELNVNRYCSEQVEDLIRSTETMSDPVQRAATYNSADRLYLDDLALIPLYQKPTLMAWNSELSGPEPNYSISSDLWNVASWTGKESIVVALPAEPETITPLSETDDSANVIMAPLLYGAYGMSPGHEYLPALVESVEVLEGQG